MSRLTLCKCEIDGVSEFRRSPVSYVGDLEIVIGGEGERFTPKALIELP